MVKGTVTERAFANALGSLYEQHCANSTQLILVIEMEKVFEHRCENPNQVLSASIFSAAGWSEVRGILRYKFDLEVRFDDKLRVGPFGCDFSDASDAQDAAKSRTDEMRSVELRAREIHTRLIESIHTAPDEINWLLVAMQLRSFTEALLLKLAESDERWVYNYENYAETGIYSHSVSFAHIYIPKTMTGMMRRLIQKEAGVLLATKFAMLKKANVLNLSRVERDTDAPSYEIGFKTDSGYRPEELGRAMDTLKLWGALERRKTQRAE